MSKRSPRGLAFSLLSLLMLAAFAGGCSFWVQDVSNHAHAVARDLDHIHWSIDRHFFNYDWDDPYIGY